MKPIILSGVPQSTNHVYKSHCRFSFPQIYMTAEGKALKESYQWEAKSQWRKKPLTEPLEISVKLFFKDKRKHDIDNYGKVVLDSLTGIVWVDDGQITKMTVSKFLDTARPRVEVEIL